MGCNDREPEALSKKYGGNLSYGVRANVVCRRRGYSTLNAKLAASGWRPRTTVGGLSD